MNDSPKHSCEYRTAIEIMIVAIDKTISELPRIPPTISANEHLATMRQCCVDMLNAADYMENPRSSSPFSPDSLN